MRQHIDKNKQHRFLKIGLCTIALGHSMHSLAAQCEFNVLNEWQSGYTGEITVYNDNDIAIDGWEVGVEFSHGESINNAWRAQLTGDNPYQFESLNWNSKINPSSSQSFGFNAKKSDGQVAVEPRLFGICENSSEDDDDGVEVEITASKTQGTAPATISFTSEVENASSNNLSYRWDFGDGQASGELNPQHIFEQAGVYQVSLTVNDGANDYQAERIEIEITEAEPDLAQCVFEVEQEWNSGFRGKVTITNIESVAISSWKVLMEFADNTKLTGVWHGKHSGNNPYEIINESYNSTINPGQSLDFGFNAQKAQENDAPTTPSLGGLCSVDGTINQAPSAIASASVLTGERPLVVDFDSSGSIDPEGDALTFSWDFGDGNTSSEPNPSYVYEREGTFSAKLTVNDGVNTKVSESISIQVSEPDVTPVDEPLVLNSQSSSLYFVSTKKQHLVEAHTFENMSGIISTQGEARLSLDLTSVNTGNETRDDRMKEFLFVTSLFPEAEVLLSVDYSAVMALPIGSTEKQSISATINLKGVLAEVNTDIAIRRLSNKKVLVQSLNPIVLDATDFGLESGIETLKSLASLSVISYAVPVSFNLVFEAQ